MNVATKAEHISAMRLFWKAFYHQRKNSIALKLNIIDREIFAINITTSTYPLIHKEAITGMSYI